MTDYLPIQIFIFVGKALDLHISRSFTHIPSSLFNLAWDALKFKTRIKI